jgi:hypothetical protein
MLSWPLTFIKEEMEKETGLAPPSNPMLGRRQKESFASLCLTRVQCNHVKKGILKQEVHRSTSEACHKQCVLWLDGCPRLCIVSVYRINQCTAL